MIRPTIRIEREANYTDQPKLTSGAHVFLVIGDEEFEIPVHAIVRRDAVGDRPLTILETRWPVEEILLERAVPIERTNNEDGA